MLSQTIRNNISEVEKQQNTRNTSIFNSLFRCVPKEDLQDSEFIAVLKKEGFGNIINPQTVQDRAYENTKKLEQKKNIQISNTQKDNPYDLVENPEEVIVEFPITSVVEMEEKLPFFKSISYKLANLYS